MIPASPRRALTGAAIAALVVGSLALSAPAFADGASPATAPALSFPGAGETVATNADITFRWSDTGATEYRFELGSNAAQLGTGLQVVHATSLVFHTPSSDSSAVWRVTAVAADGSTGVSETRTVRFASQAPNAGVGTAVTITAPAPAPAPAPPAATTVRSAPVTSGTTSTAAAAPSSASGETSSAAPASTSTSTGTAESTAPAGVSSTSNAETPSTTAARHAGSSDAVAASLDADTSARSTVDPIVVAMLVGLGIALMLAVGIRLLVLRRRA